MPDNKDLSQIEAVLRKTEARFKMVLKAARMGFWEWDFTTKTGWQSEQVGLMFGRRLGHQHEKIEHWLADVHPEDRQRAGDDLQTAIAGRRTYESSYRVLWPDGHTVRWVHAEGEITRSPHGQPLKLFAWLSDITERKREERERVLLAEIIESSHEAIISIDLHGLIATWNKGAERMFGYTVAEAIGQPITMLIPRDRKEEDVPIMDRIRKGEPFLSRERVRQRKDGSLLQVSGSISPIKDFQGEIIGASVILRDITQRKQTEEALRRSEELLRAVITTAVDGIITIDKRGIMLSANPAAEKLFGYTREEMIGKNVSMLMPEPYKSQHDGYLDNYHRTGQPKIIGRGREVRAQRKDGSIFPIDLAVGESRLGDERFYTGLVRDISKRKAAEEALEAAKQELEIKVQQRTARLRETVADLEHFSYSITHDMRAPLRAMHGFAQLLLEECAPGLDPLHRDYLERISVAATRMDELIRDALRFGKAARQHLDLAPVSPAALLRDMISSYPAFQPSKADIYIQDDMPLVLANAAGLTQCFSNLLSNAVKFVEAGKKPKVRVWAESKDGNIRIWVEDNGIGIPHEQQSRIFNMFQRLDVTQEGTGIGLALVRKVAERMQGTVGVESEPGNGSRFWLELKAACQLEPNPVS